MIVACLNGMWRAGLASVGLLMIGAVALAWLISEPPGLCAERSHLFDGPHASTFFNGARFIGPPFMQDDFICMRQASDGRLVCVAASARAAHWGQGQQYGKGDGWAYDLPATHQ